MGATTSIEWAANADGTPGATWNPLRGCSRISEGCRNCYAERMASRFSENGEPFYGYAIRMSIGPRWTGRVDLIPEMLDIPLRRRKPTTYFVNSMSDLFHEALPDEAIDQVFAVMTMCAQHRFIVLTKRAERMAKWFGVAPHEGVMTAMWHMGVDVAAVRWPLPNVILGVSCEDRKNLDRLDHLRATPAVCRVVSFEPLLEDLGTVNLDGIGWAIVGGESGPGARPMHPDWARSLRDQCAAAGVPFFFKQHGEWMPIFTGINPSENDPRCRIHEGFTFPRKDGEKIGQHMWKVGKKAAGRELYGRVWDERPDVLRGAK